MKFLRVKGVPSATGRGAFFLGQNNKNAKVGILSSRLLTSFLIVLPIHKFAV